MGLRVRGRGGRDRTAPVAAPISAFLWGSTPFLCARAKKWGGTGRSGAVYCLIKRRTRNRARQGGLVIALSACAPIRWEVVVSLSCDSTPFLWCLPKETVSSRQRKALFLPRRLHHSRERYCLGGRGSSSPDLGRGWWSSERLPSPGANGICYGRFARPVYCTGVTVVIRFRPPPKARFFGAPPRFFAQEQRNGVEWAGPARSIAQENGAHV